MIINLQNMEDVHTLRQEKTKYFLKDLIRKMFLASSFLINIQKRQYIQLLLLFKKKNI